MFVHSTLPSPTAGTGFTTTITDREIGKKENVEIN